MMGLLDSMVGMLGQAQGGNQADLMGLIGGLLDSNAPGGGLAGLVSQFQQGGLGEVVASWISTGQNLPVSAEQLQSVLGGHSGLNQLLAQTGMGQGELMGQLAKFLPLVVDQMTPNGQLPASGSTPDLGSLLGGLLGR
ncbi:MAG: YidB family protein [Ideonella sp.]